MKNPKLEAFLTKLADGRYKSIARARSALGGTIDLSEDDKAEAREAIAAFFNPKAQEPMKETVSQVESIRRTFVAAKTTLTVGLEGLLAASQRGPYSDAELTMLLGIAIEEDVITAFTELFHRNAGQITAGMINQRVLARNPRVFSFLSAVFRSPTPPREEVTRMMSQILVEEIERRASDEAQVAVFEELVTMLIAKRPTEFGFNPLTTLVVSFASPVFAQHWLLEHDHNMQSVHEFAHRMMALYLADETNAASLVTLVDTLEPERPVVEEIVRVLLAQRQLGDAIYIAGVVPEEFKPQLYKILLPMVRDYGDPLALVSFGAAFKGLADRDEIKDLVRRFLKPEVNDRLDALFDGFEPVDVFESVPSVLPPKEQAEIRNTLMRKLGLPTRETIGRYVRPA